jgi:urea transport system ATP-binding protein
MLALNGIETGYGEGTILRDISLHVDPGQVVCLLGRNGVGKTTLMKTIMGVLKLSRGSIVYNGIEMSRLPSGKRATMGIGYVPQGREIFAQLSVYDNLLLGLEACRVPSKTVPEEAINSFPVLPSLYERQGGDLSGGQQQQLAFARALASSPGLLLLDEPTEGIQPSIVQEIQEVIRRIKGKGSTAILLVEQSLDFVRSVADYFYVLEKGAIAAQGKVEQLDEAVIRKHLVV